MTYSAAALLPAVPAPPHDPRRLRLDFRTGWRALAADGVELRGEGRCGPDAEPKVQLALAEGAGDAFDSGFGTFGGLVLPATVAMAPDGGVFVLRRHDGAIRRFDGCDCAFRTIPKTGRLGPGARQFGDPRANTSCGEALLVADAGHRRISVFSFYGYLLRGHWTPPSGSVPQEWQPVAIAARRGRVVVADRANGALHFIDGAGRWIAVRPGFGVTTAVAFDAQGRVWAASEATGRIDIVDWPSGAVIGSATSTEELRGDATGLPLQLAPGGLMDFGPRCAGDGAPRWFDAGGQPVPADTVPSAAYLSQGTITLGPLDSGLHRCVWDRVILTLELPAETAVRVLAHTGEVERTEADIAALPPEAWTATVHATVAPGGEWDALLQAPPGRFLWLRLDFSSTGEGSPKLAALEVDFPRISLRRYLPAVYGEEPVSADFTDRFLGIFDRGLRDIEAQVDRMAWLFDPLSAPSERGSGDFLSWIASWIGVTLDRQLPLARRRAILKSAGALFRLRGTKTGLRALLSLYLGIDERACTRLPPRCAPCADPAPDWAPPQLILEHFTLRRWLFVGVGRLGDAARLWGERIVNRSQLGGPEENGPPGGAQLGVTQLNTVPDPLRDPFHVYAHRFTVFLPAWISRLPGRKRLVERLVRSESPGHTAGQVEWVAPRFRIGVQSMLGFDAVVGCYPQQVMLDRDCLGRATILPAADGRDRPPRLGGPRYGNSGRIGGSVL